MSDEVPSGVVGPDPERPGGRVVYLPGVEAPGEDLAPEWVHFRPLGYDRDQFFFLAARQKQILSWRAHELGNKARLLALAPLQWWERAFPSDKGFTGAAVDRAVDHLIRASAVAGPFSAARVRGRGVWLDAGRVVVHVGLYLLVDGVRVELHEMESRAIYEARPALEVEVDLGDPLSADEGALLWRWAVSLAWESAGIGAGGQRTALHGTLLAGWMVCGLLTGALGWRPHAFVTGPSGTGKSQVVMRVARHLLGGFALRVKSAETTAPGVRQRLGPDALAVTLDEAEADGEGAERRLRDMLALMRVASSDDDADVLKGGAHGQAVGYVMRSAFLSAAIRVPMTQRADETRISVLSLREPTDEDRRRFGDDTLEMMLDLLTPEYAARWRARVLGRVAQVAAAAEVFGAAVTEHLGSPRMGDQLGALLAGAWVLRRDDAPSREAARRWVQAQDWGRSAEVAEDRDELKLLAALLETQCQVSVDRTRYDASIGELVGLASGRTYERAIDRAAAAGELARHGMRVIGEALAVSNTHRGVARMLQGTAYGVGWRDLLRRLPGATASEDSLNFAGSKSRATLVPLGVLGLPDPPPPTG